MANLSTVALGIATCALVASSSSALAVLEPAGLAVEPMTVGAWPVGVAPRLDLDRHGLDDEQRLVVSTGGERAGFDL